MIKAKIGDKVKIVNAGKSYTKYYDDGAEGVVVDACGTWVGVDVKFSSGYKLTLEEDASQQFHVYHEEYEIINDESKTQVKKEKEMEDKITLKQGVYAVVETGSKSVVDVFTNRGAARYWMQGMKQEFPECSYKLAKLSVDKWIR